MPNRKNIWIRQKLDELQRLNPKCMFCGTTKNLDFVPINNNGTFRGRKERYYDIIRHPRNYIRLCRRCHSKWSRNKGKINV